MRVSSGFTGSPPTKRTGTMGAPTRMAMSMKAPLIFSTGRAQVRARVPSMWTITDRPGETISWASSAMMPSRESLSSRSK